MAKKQPIHPEFDKFRKAMGRLNASLSAGIRRRIKKGMTPRKATNATLKDLGYKDILAAKIIQGAVNVSKSVLGGIEVDPLGIRDTWLNKHFAGDNLTLSKRINEIAKFPDIVSSLNTSMRNQESWITTANRLAKQNLQKADLAAHATELEKSARQVMKGDVTAFKQYKADLNKSIRQVKKLQQHGAPTGRLKKAYEGVINVSRGTSEKALNKAMDKLIKAKAGYNSDRIARTEKARAYGQATFKKSTADPDVIGLRWDISARHMITDICDFHAGADLYNLGPGGYPMNNFPVYPAHPQCTCVISDIFSGEPKEEVKEGGAKFIKKQSTEKQKQMLGVQGAEDFRRNRKTWDKNLRNYKGHQSVKSLINT